MKWNCNYQSGVDGKRGNDSVNWSGGLTSGPDAGKKASKMKPGGRKLRSKSGSSPSKRKGEGHGGY